jgi:lipopolysaccharide transport system permease protein
MNEVNTPYNIIIEPNRVQKEYLKDLFRYRELFYFFAWRDILVRYKQAFFGISWALFRPLLNMVLFTLLFGRLAKLPSDNVNYGLFVLAGMLPWQLFANSIAETCLSLLNHSHLVSKIYFPRMIIPTSLIIVHLLDFSISGVLLLLLALFSGSMDWLTILTLPFFIAQAILLCVGVSLWLSALTVQFRDFRFIVPFAVQAGMFISPVGYGSFIIPDVWQPLYFLNPMAGIIDGFRWALFGASYANLPLSIGMSVAVTAALLVSGFYYFRKMERTFADRI